MTPRKIGSAAVGLLLVLAVACSPAPSGSANAPAQSTAAPAAAAQPTSAPAQPTTAPAAKPTTAPQPPAATTAPAAATQPTAAAKPAATTAAPTTAPAAAASGALEKVTVRTDFTPGGKDTPYYLAKAKGYYAEQGLDVDVEPGKSSLNTIQLVASGQETFGIIDAAVYVQSRQQGLPLMMVADYIQKSSGAVFYFCDQNITKPQDLKGKRLVAVAGDANAPFFQALLEQNGMSLNDIKITNVDAAARTPLMIQGQADLGLGPLTGGIVQFEVAAEKAGKGKTCTMPFADYGLSTLSYGVIVNQDTIKNKPDVIRKFLAASNKGWADALKDPQPGWDAMIKQYPEGDLEYWKRGFAAVPSLIHTQRTADKPFGYMDPADWQDTLNVMQKYFDLKDPKPASEYFTDEFVPKQ